MIKKKKKKATVEEFDKQIELLSISLKEKFFFFSFKAENIFSKSIIFLKNIL